MPAKEKGRILLALTGLNPRPWYELLSQHREVVTEPASADDPSITYAAVSYTHLTLPTICSV